MTGRLVELGRSLALRCLRCGLVARFQVLAGDPEQMAMAEGWMTDPDVCPACRAGGEW